MATRGSYVSIDDTDFKIYEPTPFIPKWFSHKFHGPGVCYEIGIVIAMGWIVWVNGPFPSGEWTDLAIARSALLYELDEGEVYMADSGYLDHSGLAITPSRRHEYSNRQWQL